MTIPLIYLLFTLIIEVSHFHSEAKAINDDNHYYESISNVKRQIESDNLVISICYTDFGFCQFRMQDRSIEKVSILLANLKGEKKTPIFSRTCVWLQEISNAMFRQRYSAVVCPCLNI